MTSLLVVVTRQKEFYFSRDHFSMVFPPNPCFGASVHYEMALTLRKHFSELSTTHLNAINLVCKVGQVSR